MQFKQQQLQHLGIIAGICNEIGLIDRIDTKIEKKKRKVSVGQAVQAMILNALGFSGRALYLTPDFFRNRPLDLLIGENITADDLHDDCLGTALDALYEYGITELFYHLASNALKTYEIEHRYVHLDTSTFSFHGKSYEDTDDDTQTVSITKGYSKDNHPELNQAVLSLMCSQKSTLPVWLEVLSGNSSDKKSFAESIKKYRNNFRTGDLPYFVMDGAFYTKENIRDLSDIIWVTRVPERIKEVKNLIEELDHESLLESDKAGYYYKEINSDWAGIDQRWLIVFSEAAYHREIKTFDKNLAKAQIKADKEFWHLCNKPFACKTDALKAVKAFNRKTKYFTAEYKTEKKLKFLGKGRPKKNAVPEGEEWFLSGNIIEDKNAIESTRKRKGLFVIATNNLDIEDLGREQLLDIYKSQGTSVEKGFRFLKDPLFFAESLFLKSTKRIMALMMVMGISLLVYSLAERKLRKSMREENKSIPNQVKKETQNPTIRWVIQMFEDVLLLVVKSKDSSQNIIGNLTEAHKTVIKCLGKEVEKIYFSDS